MGDDPDHVKDVPDHIEHTVLGPATTWDDVTETLDTALEFGMRACIPPCYVERATTYTPTVDVTTVIDFPHGQRSVTANCCEAERAWQDGASELDLVANIGYLRAGEDERLETELREVVAAVPLPVKVIVEAPLLTTEELHHVCEIATDADAAFLKTATGFSNGGATVEDVETMSEYLPVKASGGVDSWAFAEELFAAGAARIGASSGETIVREYREVY